MLRRGSKVIKYAGTLTLFGLILAQHAQGYIDPGSSSFIVQMLIAGAAGAALAIATFWRRIFAFFSKRRGKDGGTA